MKKLFLICSLSILTGFILFGCGAKEESGTPERTTVMERPLEGKRVVMVIAEKDFRDEELLDPESILADQGAIVTIASTTMDSVMGMQGTGVHPDMLVSEIEPEDWDAVVFVGGVGASQYWDDSTAHSIAKGALDAGKIVGAICIAPVTLANAGILQGKKVTCWQSEVDKLKAKGAEYTGADVERDGKIITASGPEAAISFGLKLSEALQEKQEEETTEGM
ncbi:MAG: DJ-1/PfpI family protein [Candidatus Zixiibacteriota bacterium]